MYITRIKALSFLFSILNSASELYEKDDEKEIKEYPAEELTIKFKKKKGQNQQKKAAEEKTELPAELLEEQEAGEGKEHKENKENRRRNRKNRNKNRKGSGDGENEAG